MSRLLDAGLRLPPFGLGTAALGGLHGPIRDDVASDALDVAWETGIRFYDTAPLYGRGLGELRTGAALRRRPRADIILSTKVGWRVHPLEHGAAPGGSLPFGLSVDYSRDGTMRSVEDSLLRLGLERIDIALVHDLDPYNHGERYPERLREALAGALPTLSELKRQGAVRAIGIGVNDPAVCLDVLAEAELDCILLAGRFTLLDRSAERALLPECLRRGVEVIVGAPFNTGLLAQGTGGARRYNHRDAPEPVLRRVREIEAVCQVHGVALPAAALQFPRRHAAVSSVLPGPRSADQVRGVAEHARAPISDEFWAELASAGLLAPLEETT